MKKTLLVLDAFTNGHESAMEFIRRQGWNVEDCNIVFCGTHSALVDRLKEGAAYAVLPVRNSIAGEVGEVVRALMATKEIGYDFVEVDRVDLQINHCLMAPQHVARIDELDRVMSHEKAIAQCGRFLDSVGITPDKRSRKDSTGNAAKAVSRLGPKVKIGAIAPRAAAEAYGLRILAEGIQDVPNNKTTFVLLRNEAKVESVVVGILGITGAFGQLLKRFFEALGCTVIGSGKRRSTGLTNTEVVKRADVVIFSVPIADTVDVIRKVLPYTRPDQLLMDVTSVKVGPVEEMLKSQAQVVVGLHPMFRPERSFEGQTTVVCPARLNDSRWKTWVVNMLAATGSVLKWSTAENHDSVMIVVQVNPHLSNLASALMIVEANISVAESLQYASPFYQIALAQMGRLVSQGPDLYASIIMANPQTVAMLERRIEIEKRLLEIIRRGDHESLERLFTAAKEHFGPEVVRSSNELFTRLISVLNTLYGKNSVTLEFTKGDNRPGLLERVAGVFSRHGVNLTAFNTVNLDGKHIQFTISLEQPRTSDEVRRALEEIEGWKRPRIRVR